MVGDIISFVSESIRLVVVYFIPMFVCSGCYLSNVGPLKLINCVPIINVQMYGCYTNEY